MAGERRALGLQRFLCKCEMKGHVWRFDVVQEVLLNYVLSINGLREPLCCTWQSPCLLWASLMSWAAISQAALKVNKPFPSSTSWLWAARTPSSNTNSALSAQRAFVNLSSHQYHRSLASSSSKPREVVWQEAGS